MKLLKETPIIRDAFTQKPLTISDGTGVSDAFVISKWKGICATGNNNESKLMRCAGNMLWVNPLYTPTPGVPWSLAQLKTIRKQKAESKMKCGFRWKLYETFWRNGGAVM